MKTYYFYQDVKVKSWDRTHFTVKANSHKEAESELKKYANQEICDVQSSFEICLGSVETVTDCQTTITVDENEGFSTMEIYNDKGEELCNNSIQGWQPTIGDDKQSTINELSCKLAYQDLIDMVDVTPEELIDEATNTYKEEYQTEFDRLYDRYYTTLTNLIIK